MNTCHVGTKSKYKTRRCASSGSNRSEEFWIVTRPLATCEQFLSCSCLWLRADQLGVAPEVASKKEKRSVSNRWGIRSCRVFDFSARPAWTCYFAGSQTDLCISKKKKVGSYFPTGQSKLRMCRHSSSFKHNKTGLNRAKSPPRLGKRFI